MPVVRHEAAVTSLSWIPSEAVEGFSRVVFDRGITHYDEPPPDVVDDLEPLREADRFRFANRLAAWIESDDGRITGYGYSGGGVMGSTLVHVGPARARFEALDLPDIQHPPEVKGNSVRFVQTAGGRTGLPAPRLVGRFPWIQYRAPLVWTTLELTLRDDGEATWDVVGASPFPRHWIYGTDGVIAAKVGLARFRRWWRVSFGRHSPWGKEDTPALLIAAESALERQLSLRIMRESDPEIRTLRRGGRLTRQGERGNEIFLVLDGLLQVEVDGNRLAEIGPGAILGEHALLQGGSRTATLTAVTRVRVAVIAAEQLDRTELSQLGLIHRREDESS